MLSYQVEQFSYELVDELKVLLEAHWEEIAMYKDKIAFAPDYTVYGRLATVDGLHIVTVRDDGKLIGYYISFLYYHPHYKHDKFAINDIMFIDKEHRGGTAGYRLLKFAESELKSIGVSVMMLHMKTEFPFEGLCQAIGMDRQEIVYSKYLGE